MNRDNAIEPRRTRRETKPLLSRAHHPMGEPSTSHTELPGFVLFVNFVVSRGFQEECNGLH